MDEHTLRAAVGLRLGTAITAPHKCQHCGKEVDCQGTHGLSGVKVRVDITDMTLLTPSFIEPLL